MVLSPGWIDILDPCVQGLLGETMCQGRRSESVRVDTAATFKTVKAETLGGEDIISAAADENGEPGLAILTSSRRRS